MHIIRLTPYFYFPNIPVTDWTLQFEPIGGMQIQIAEFTNAVDALGIKQTVVTTGVPGIEKYCRHGEHGSVYSVRLPLAPIRTESKGLLGLLVSWGVGSVLWGIRQRLKRSNGNFDLIHCHCSELPWTYLFAPIVARIMQVPLVLTVHCSALATIHPETISERLYYFGARIAEKHAILEACRVITLTNRLKHYYVENKIASSEKINVIPDGLQSEKFVSSLSCESVEDFRRRFNIPDNRRVILFLGRIAPEKGWMHFVEARKLLRQKDLHFLVCGDGNQRKLMEKMIEEYQLQDNFTVTGFIPHNQVACAIALSEVVVMPSLHEEMGGTILEAMALGKPIVATRVGGIPEVIQHGINGWLIQPGSSAEVACAIETLLENTDLASSLGRNGVATVQARFNMIDLAKQAVEIYDSVL